MSRIAVSVFCLLLPAAAFSQQPLRYAVKDTISLKPLIGTFSPVVDAPHHNVQAIPRNFYTQHLGFFCRQELKMQQVHVPVTFRLGSMEYCNYLEQKPGYR